MRRALLSFSRQASTRSGLSRREYAVKTFATQSGALTSPARPSVPPRTQIPVKPFLYRPAGKSYNDTPDLDRDDKRPGKIVHYSEGDVWQTASWIAFRQKGGTEWRRWSYTTLRETCRCDRCVHPSTQQRLMTLGQMRAELEQSGWLSGDYDKISENTRWDDEMRFRWAGQWHSIPVTAFNHTPQPLAIRDYYLKRVLFRRGWSDVAALHERASTHGRAVFVDYSSGGDFLRQILEQVQILGIVVIKGVPTEENSLVNFARQIGPIRNTFYGQTWDVKSVRNSKNIAYTDLDLGLHMDLLYHTEPPRFQLLHCLRNRVQGGESYFVDAFAAAGDFAHPREKKLLQRMRLNFAYDNDGHLMENAHTVLPQSLRPLRSGIAWSPPFQSHREYSDGKLEEDFIKALVLWEAHLAQDSRKFEFKMEEGDLVFFDNRRVLHARRAFRNEEAGVDGEPQRWLKGCYLDGDTVWDKLATLEVERRSQT